MSEKTVKQFIKIRGAKEHNLKNISLTDFDCIIDVAAEQGYIRPEDRQRLLAFRNHPDDESWIGGAR